MKNFLLAVGILAGTIIGAGIFSLPYVFTELGFLPGFFYLIIFAFIYYIVHSRYVDILQSEEFEEHHFLYFSKKYLSKFWSKVASFSVILELVFGLTIYLILSKSFAGFIFGDVGITGIIIFWLLGSVLIFSRSSWIGWAELIGGLGIFVIVFFILLAGEGGSINMDVVGSFDLMKILLPFGPLLFAFGGRAAISKIVEFYRSLSKGNKFPLKKAVFWGTFLPIFIYLIFIFGVVRIVPDVSPDTLGSLVGFDSGILIIIGAVGLLTLWTSYLIIGSNIYDILRFDVLGNNWWAGILAFFGPLILYFLGLKNFINAVSITGGLFLALEAWFVLVMWSKIKKRSVFWKNLPLYMVFFISILYQVFDLLR